MQAMRQMTKIVSEGFSKAINDQATIYFDKVARILKENVEAKYSCKASVNVMYDQEFSSVNISFIFLEGVDNIPEVFCDDWDGNICTFDEAIEKFNIRGEA